MVIRTVRLDDETEKALAQVTKKTGWSVSAALKRGILILRDEVGRSSQQSAFEIYRRLDLGPGGVRAGAFDSDAAGYADSLAPEIAPMILVDTGPPVSRCSILKVPNIRDVR